MLWRMVSTCKTDLFCRHTAETAKAAAVKFVLFQSERHSCVIVLKPFCVYKLCRTPMNYKI